MTGTAMNADPTRLNDALILETLKLGGAERHAELLTPSSDRLTELRKVFEDNGAVPAGRFRVGRPNVENLVAERRGGNHPPEQNDDVELVVSLRTNVASSIDRACVVHCRASSPTVRETRP